MVCKFNRETFGAFDKLLAIHQNFLLLTFLIFKVSPMITTIYSSSYICHSFEYDPFVKVPPLHCMVKCDFVVIFTCVRY